MMSRGKDDNVVRDIVERLRWSRRWTTRALQRDYTVVNVIEDRGDVTVYSSVRSQ